MSVSVSSLASCSSLLPSTTTSREGHLQYSLGGDRAVRRAPAGGRDGERDGGGGGQQHGPAVGCSEGQCDIGLEWSHLWRQESGVRRREERLGWRRGPPAARE